MCALRGAERARLSRETARVAVRTGALLVHAPPGATRRAACEHARGESVGRASEAAGLTPRTAIFETSRFRNASLTTISISL